MDVHYCRDTATVTMARRNPKARSRLPHPQIYVYIYVNLYIYLIIIMKMFRYITRFYKFGTLFNYRILMDQWYITVIIDDQS